MKDENSPSTLYFSDHRHKNGNQFIDFDAKRLDPSRFYRACIRQQLQPQISLVEFLQTALELVYEIWIGFRAARFPVMSCHGSSRTKKLPTENLRYAIALRQRLVETNNTKREILRSCTQIAQLSRSFILHPSAFILSLSGSMRTLRSRIGNRMVRVSPFPSVLSIASSPPCSRTIRLTMRSPRPDPPLFVVK